MHRRRFLVLAGSAAGAWTIGCRESSDEDDNRIAIGPTNADEVRVALRDLPANGVTLAAGVFVARDSRGCYAMSAVCTHEGCALSAPASCDAACGSASAPVIQCPCHGARFDRDGLVLGGPASGPLPHFATRIDGTDLVVNPNSTVPASARTSV